MRRVSLTQTDLLSMEKDPLNNLQHDLKLS
jgi:hypothetical protein